MRFWLIVLVFLLEAWAIVAVLRTTRTPSGKTAWISGIVLLPVVGVLAWVGWGQRTDAAG